jgi:lipoprotein-releasing system ATP-binding protein
MKIVSTIFKDLSTIDDLSLLIVTHDEDFANKMDRIITMGDGAIIL